MHATKPTTANSLLSQREFQILQLISYEHKTYEIAETLFISIPTVESHRRNIMNKLKVSNVAGMIRRGFEYGLLS